jgi:hypothetical protein
MKPLTKPLLFGICTWLMLSIGPTALAQTVPLPKSQIQSLDLTNMTFTVTLKGTNLTVFITSETRLFKNGNYAISKDLTVGDTVHGSLRKKGEGRHEAVRIFVSAAPAKALATAAGRP